MDRWSGAQRSALMARVKNRHTGPELRVRSLLHRLGYRFRLHRRDLPGSPDIVLPRHRKVIFVHGCFWHGHDCPRGARPITRTDFWDAKLDRNVVRDREDTSGLEAAGWRVLVLWECQTKNDDDTIQLLRTFLEDAP